LDALGARIRESTPGTDGHWREIVGVVQDVHEDALNQAPPPMAYWPTIMDKFLGQGTFGMPAINFVIRSERAGTASFVREIEQAV